MSGTREPGGSTPRLGRSALIVAAVSALTLLLTLAWQTLVAQTFGASAELDAFWVALGIPRAIAESLHLGLLTLLFVLVFSPRTEAGADPWRRASAVLNVTLAATAAGIVLLLAAAPALVRLMAPGMAAAQQALATSLLRQLAFMLVPTAIAAAIGGLAVARGALLPFTLSRAAMPALQLAALLALAGAIGIRSLVWALWIGAAGSLLIFLPWLRRAGVRYHAGVDWREPATRRILGLQGMLAVIWLIILLNQLVDRGLASGLGAGSVSALEFAWRFEIPISQIVSLGVALPTFALLAQSASPDRRAEFRAALAASARLLVLAVLPMLGFMVVLREPLARVWLERGAFSAESAQLVASLLPALAVVYFCRAFASILVFGLLTVGRSRLLVAGLAVELAIHAGLGYVLGRSIGLPGVVWASAIAMFAVNATLWVMLLREVGGVAVGEALRRTGPVVAAALVVIVLLEGARRVFADRIGFGGLEALLPLAAAGAGYLAAYVAVCAATGVIDLRGGRLRPRLAARSAE